MSTKDLIKTKFKKAFPILVMAILLLAPSFSLASVENKSQAWSILRYTYNYSEDFVGGQLQNRYNVDQGEGFEEQLNLFFGSYWKDIEYKLIGTLGTQNAYKKIRGIRLAFEGEKDFKLSSRFVYSLRLRQEVRDFREVDDLAYRFRVRNEMSHSLMGAWFSGLSLSSEVSIYLNDY